MTWKDGGDLSRGSLQLGTAANRIRVVIIIIIIIITIIIIIAFKPRDLYYRGYLNFIIIIIIIITIIIILITDDKGLWQELTRCEQIMYR